MVTMLLFSCDRAEKQAEQFVKNCYILQEDLLYSSVREELLTVAKYSERFKPAFSAVEFTI